MNDTSLLKNFSGLRTFSDLFTSENLAKGVDMMKRPAAIAIAASLGIHGVLGISFPLLSGSSPKERQTPVKLVDLTPDEQSKLPPQSPTSGIILPPLNGPVLPSATNPAAGSFFKFQPNTPQTPFFNASPASGTSGAAQPNNSLFSSSVSPTIISPDYFLNGFSPSNESGNTPLPPGPSPSPTPSPSPSGSPSPTPSPTESPSPGPVPTPSPTATPVASPAELELAAKNQQARRLAGVKIAQQLSLAQRDGGTSSSIEDLDSRYSTWQANLLAASQGRITPENLPTGTTPYPEPIPPIECQNDACEGKSVIFVVAIDPEGQMLGDPGVIRTTGDKALDQAATQVFLNTLLPNLQKPPAKKRLTLYSVSVDFIARMPS